MNHQHILFLEEADAVARPKNHFVLPPPEAGPLRDALGELMLEETSRQQLGVPKRHLILPPPKVKPLHEVFARVMLEDASRQQSAIPKQHLILPPPKVEPPHDVFAEAMLEDTATHQRRSPLDWVASIGVHFAILAVLLILPLYFTSALNIQRFNLTFLVPPLAPPAAAPPAPMAAPVSPRPVRTSPGRVYVPGKLTAPSFIPKAVAATVGESSVPEDVSAGILGGVPGGMPGGQLGGVIGGVLGGVTKNEPAPAAPAAERSKTPVQVGGSVKPPRLIYSPDPEYPVLARMSHIVGTVVIEAIIDENGNVSGMRAISGPAILIPAALSAVAKRKYEPTILDGEPTAIDLRVEVIFAMTVK